MQESRKPDRNTTIRSPKRLALYACAAIAAFACSLPAAAEDQISERTGELKTIEQQIDRAKARTAALDREREALEAELTDISRRMVELAGNIQSREARISESEGRLNKLAGEEKVLRGRLKQRRAELAELLAGLQRLERNPPPPLVVNPDDARKAVRGSLLFGAIVPSLNGQAARLARELAELDAVRQRILATRQELDRHVASLNPARAELEELLSRKKQLLASTAEQLEAEQERTRKLAQKASDIRQLLASLAQERQKAEIARKQEAARKAQEAEAARLKAEAEAARLSAEKRQAALRKLEEERKLREAEERKRLAALKPKTDRKPVRFAKAVGALAWPAQGERVRQFGDKDGFGGTSEGIFIATGKQAQITSPADGKIEFAGTFRSYGKLVIVNVGDGYHLLLAGLDNITVSAGQPVHAGEPVGAMGTQPARATLIGDRIDDLRPILYVEVRKGANAINSGKWWLNNTAKAAQGRNKAGNEG